MTTESPATPSPDIPSVQHTLVPSTHILVPLALFAAMAKAYWGTPAPTKNVQLEGEGSLPDPSASMIVREFPGLNPRGYAARQLPKQATKSPEPT